jgi:hypothetical protein
MLAPRDENDILTSARESSTEETAGASGPVDRDA